MKHLLIPSYDFVNLLQTLHFEVFVEGVASPQFRGSRPGDEELPVTSCLPILLSSLPQSLRFSSHLLSSQSPSATSSSLLSNPGFQHESDKINPLFKKNFTNMLIQLLSIKLFFLTYFH